MKIFAFLDARSFTLDSRWAITTSALRIYFLKRNAARTVNNAVASDDDLIEVPTDSCSILLCLRSRIM